MSTRALFLDEMKKTVLACLIDADANGASACPMAAFSGCYKSPGPPPSGDTCGIVQAHHHGHRNSQQSGYILHHHFVCCCPGNCQGDTEQVVA